MSVPVFYGNWWVYKIFALCKDKFDCFFYFLGIFKDRDWMMKFINRIQMMGTPDPERSVQKSLNFFGYWKTFLSSMFNCILISVLSCFWFGKCSWDVFYVLMFLVYISFAIKFITISISVEITLSDWVHGLRLHEYTCDGICIIYYACVNCFFALIVLGFEVA